MLKMSPTREMNANNHKKWQGVSQRRTGGVHPLQVRENGQENGEHGVATALEMAPRSL